MGHHTNPPRTTMWVALLLALAVLSTPGFAMQSAPSSSTMVTFSTQQHGGVRTAQWGDLTFVLATSPDEHHTQACGRVGLTPTSKVVVLPHAQASHNATLQYVTSAWHPDVLDALARTWGAVASPAGSVGTLPPLNDTEQPSSVGATRGLRGCCVSGMWCDVQRGNHSALRGTCFSQGFGGRWFVNHGRIPGHLGDTTVPVYTCANDTAIREHGNGGGAEDPDANAADIRFQSLSTPVVSRVTPSSGAAGTVIRVEGHVRHAPVVCVCGAGGGQSCSPPACRY